MADRLPSCYIYMRQLIRISALGGSRMYFPQPMMSLSSQGKINKVGDNAGGGGIPRARTTINNNGVLGGSHGNTNSIISNIVSQNGMGNNDDLGEKSFSERWRSIIDNCIIEFMAVLFVNLTTVMCWDFSGDNQTLQFIPALVLGLVLLCLKDEDYFFPDASHTVTLVVWALGGYRTWSQPCARLFGQTVGLAVSMWICSVATLPHIVIHVQHPLSIVFVLEIIGTALEHMAVVYVILPLLPSESAHGSNFKFPKVKPKSHKDTEAPSNHSVMHAAITFTGVHFCLWRSFNVEMNPSVTILLAFIRQIQEQASLSTSSSSSAAGTSLEHNNSPTPHHGPSPWSHATMAIWGQLVGVLVCVVYTVLYVPRETKYWPSSTVTKRATGGGGSNASNSI
jgi:glycerol uptake facilitator-like aquaporin